MSKSNVFQDILNDAKGTKLNIMGQDYPYYKYIKTPTQLGISDQGTLEQLNTDLNGLTNYVDLLVSGKSNASVTGQPLGNKFFFNTGGKCSNINNKEEVNRYAYINNIQEQNIPISTSTEVNESKGLIPSAINSANNLNPFTLFQAFLTGSKPDCQEITMETVDVYNQRSTETHFVTLTDIKNMNPCWFIDKKNPITKELCKEGFTDLQPENININSHSFFTDPIATTYLASLGALGIYILYKVMIKYDLIPKI
jgi:hypothetical protein